jgi:hypothetical protein
MGVIYNELPLYFFGPVIYPSVDMSGARISDFCVILRPLRMAASLNVLVNRLTLPKGLVHPDTHHY